jgi:hypothetical protein
MSTWLTQASLGNVSQKFMAVEPLKSPALCGQPLKRERAGRPAGRLYKRILAMHDAREDERFRHGGIKFSQCTPAESLAALF